MVAIVNFVAYPHLRGKQPRRFPGRCIRKLHLDVAANPEPLLGARFRATSCRPHRREDASTGRRHMERRANALARSGHGRILDRPVGIRAGQPRRGARPVQRSGSEARCRAELGRIAGREWLAVVQHELPRRSEIDDRVPFATCRHRLHHGVVGAGRHDTLFAHHAHG